ncbi:MAG: hypothetical protein PVJ21_19915 [Anaerolineales bacterium]|jgi:hypothetical protein
MTLTSKPLAAIVLFILFGGILFSNEIGWWQTESTKEAAVFTEGDFAGLPNPADIRGSYTFGDVERNFDIPATTLAQAFGVSSESDVTDFPVKDLESIYADLEFEIGTASVRLFVALYAGLPYEIADDLYLPKRAVEMLKSHATLTPDQINYLDAHAVTLAPVNAAQGASQPVSEAQPDGHTETESTDRLLKGKTTFLEVLDWGVPQETIESILGEPMPNPLTKVKDYCFEVGLSFEEVKFAIQAEIDKIAP